MRKIFAVLVCALLLTGCGAEETFETIADEPVLQASVAGEIQISLPEDATVLTMESGAVGSLYLCDGYFVALQTMPGGDLERTFRELSGFQKDALTVLQTDQDGLIRYECVWSAAGEGGNQICRAVILDDGNYHYTVTAMADHTQSGKLTDTWTKMFRSVKVSTG